MEQVSIYRPNHIPQGFGPFLGNDRMLRERQGCTGGDPALVPELFRKRGTPVGSRIQGLNPRGITVRNPVLTAAVSRLPLNANPRLQTIRISKTSVYSMPIEDEFFRARGAVLPVTYKVPGLRQTPTH